MTMMIVIMVIKTKNDNDRSNCGDSGYDDKDTNNDDYNGNDDGNDNDTDHGDNVDTGAGMRLTSALMYHHNDANDDGDDANQVSYKVQCPTGLMYNPVTKHCDWANNVHCVNIHHTNSPTAAATTTTTTTTTTTAPLAIATTIRPAPVRTTQPPQGPATGQSLCCFVFCCSSLSWSLKGCKI